MDLMSGRPGFAQSALDQGVLVAAELLMIWIVVRNALALTDDHFGPWFASVARFPFFEARHT